MKYIDEKEITEETYQEIFKNEPHFTTRIIEIDGVYRWEGDKRVQALMNTVDLNQVWKALWAMGLDKNSDMVRMLYRNMGYSLFAYWEVFYWEVNNPKAHEYRPQL